MTRLIFFPPPPDESGARKDEAEEEGEIEALLMEAMRLREMAGLQEELADTLNSLGNLKQKQHKHVEAEAMYAA